MLFLPRNSKAWSTVKRRSWSHAIPWKGAVPMKPQGDAELIGRHHLEGTPKLEGPVCMDFELMFFFFFLGGGLMVNDMYLHMFSCFV